jgi:hypothetical protein
MALHFGGMMPRLAALIATAMLAGCNTAGDALDGLNGYVAWLVAQAAKRAGENGRKTVRAHDFIVM